MRLQTLMIVVLALTFGGIAAGGVLLLSNEAVVQKQDRATMLIVSADISRGETLVAESVTVRECSREAVLPGTMTRVEDVVGRAALAPLFKGEPLLDVKLAPKGAGRGLTSLIKKGMRAITIPTPNVGTGVAGFIVPGSRVDVHWNPQDSLGRQEPVNSPLLEDVEVLAVDDKIDAPAANRTEASQMKSVTVQVLPEEAGKLTPALGKGTIHLSLRNPGDDMRLPPRPIAIPTTPISAPSQVRNRPTPVTTVRVVRTLRGTHESSVSIRSLIGSTNKSR